MDDIPNSFSAIMRLIYSTLLDHNTDQPMAYSHDQLVAIRQQIEDAYGQQFDDAREMQPVDRIAKAVLLWLRNDGTPDQVLALDADELIGMAQELDT
jgi:hypothetical protein